MLHEVVWVSRELAVDIGDVELQVRFEAVLDELRPVLDNNTRRKNIGKIPRSKCMNDIAFRIQNAHEIGN